MLEYGSRLDRGLVGVDVLNVLVPQWLARCCVDILEDKCEVCFWLVQLIWRRKEWLRVDVKHACGDIVRALEQGRRAEVAY